MHVEIVRAPGGQLIRREKTGAAAGKPAATSCSLRSLPDAQIENLFVDYEPPNTTDYLPGALAPPKLWPNIAPGWCITYHTELVKNPPRAWINLTKPEYLKDRSRR